MCDVCLTCNTWKQLLDLDACTECGRCQDVCPVYVSDQPFSPRDVIIQLRNCLHQDAQTRIYSNGKLNIRALITDVLGDETVWFCRTCRACMEECPIFVEHIPKFIEPRRYQVMEKASFPKVLAGQIFD